MITGDNNAPLDESGEDNGQYVADQGFATASDAGLGPNKNFFVDEALHNETTQKTIHLLLDTIGSFDGSSCIYWGSLIPQ